MNRFFLILFIIPLAFNAKGQHFVSIQIAPLTFLSAGDSVFNLSNFIKPDPSTRLNYKLIDKNSGFGAQASAIASYKNETIIFGAQFSIKKQLFTQFRHSVYIGLGPSVYSEYQLNAINQNMKYEISWICPNISYFYSSKKKRNKKQWALSVSLSQNYKQGYGLYFGFEKYLADWKRKSDCNCPQFK